MTSKRVPGTHPDTSCSIPDTRWRSCLTVLPFFTLKNPPHPHPFLRPQQPNSSKFTGHVSPIHQYPHWVSSQFMTGQHMHVIAYKYPIFGQCAPDQEFKKKREKIPKPTPPINPGLFFSSSLGQTAVNFPLEATKKKQWATKNSKYPQAS